MPQPPRAVLLDLDGTVYDGDRVIPGVADALALLRERGVPLRFVTNTTRHSRRGLVARLEALGVPAAADEILTAPRAAVDWLRGHGIRRVALYVAAAAHEEFAEFEVASARPEAVVVGDLGADWTFERLNDAFLALLDGARLVAIQKNRYWSTGGALTLDAGPFVAALEFAAATEATLVGKPSAAFFAAAARSLGLPPAAIAMVGDDVDGDVAGAQRAGLRGVLVRTGKYRSGDETRGGARPDAVLASAAGLPAWLA